MLDHDFKISTVLLKILLQKFKWNSYELFIYFKINITFRYILIYIYIYVGIYRPYINSLHPVKKN
jgi:hypothetical protein